MGLSAIAYRLFWLPAGSLKIVMKLLQCLQNWILFKNQNYLPGLTTAWITYYGACMNPSPANETRCKILLVCD